MNVFGIGPIELLVILVVALLILGPNGMIESARGIGKMIRQVREATDLIPDLLHEDQISAKQNGDDKIPKGGTKVG